MEGAAERMAKGQARQDGEWGGGRGGHVQAASVSTCGHDGEHLRVSWTPILSERGDGGLIGSYCPGGPDSDFEYSTQSYTGYEVS